MFVTNKESEDELAFHAHSGLYFTSLVYSFSHSLRGGTL
jgi:hypothetical protein